MKHKKNQFQSDFENNDTDIINDSSADISESEESIKELSREERKMIRDAKRKGIDRSTLDPYDKSDLAEARRYAKKNKFNIRQESFLVQYNFHLDSFRYGMQQEYRVDVRFLLFLSKLLLQQFLVLLMPKVS